MRCEVQGCKAEAQRTLRIPKVHVCEIHYQRNKMALTRMRQARYIWKKICGTYYPGIGRRWYNLHRDSRPKKEKITSAK